MERGGRTALRPARWAFRTRWGLPWRRREIDLIIVPGLAFDRAWPPAGQGGATTNRYLPRCRAVTVGLRL
jgi:5-formyltetrahydrofolate cyclo-ligase